MPSNALLPAIDLEDPLDPPLEQPWPWRTVLRWLAAGLVVLFAGFLATEALIDRTPRTDPTMTDDFDRPDGTALSTTSDGRPWQAIGAVWEVRDGRAVVRDLEGDTALAVTDVGSADGEVAATLDGGIAGAGLVFRFQDRSNYWLLRPTPRFATWSLRRVVAGEQQQVDTTGLTGTTGDLRVSVLLDGEQIRVLIGGSERVALRDPMFADAQRAGFWVDTNGAPMAAFDDLVTDPAPSGG